MAEANCIFCKIVKGDIPCVKIGETERLLSFLDIAPVTPGHALVIPKAHYATLFDLPAGLDAELMAEIKRIGRAVMEATGAAGLNVGQNNFPAAGQLVPHAHFHLIPRTVGDGLSLWPGKKYESDDAMRRLAEAIRRAAA